MSRYLKIKKIKFWIYSLFLLPLLHSGAASNQKPPEEPNKKTLVFLGDSLTAGYGLSEENSYPALIEKFLAQDKIDWAVINAGLSGDTTRGGLKRLRWVLKSNPSLVFVALGANDGLRGLNVEETKKNLENIILELKKAGAQVVLAGMQLPTNYGELYRKKFKEMYKGLSEKHRISLFPFLLENVAMEPVLNLSDGIHPNERGQEIIAQNVYKFLKPILNTP